MSAASATICRKAWPRSIWRSKRNRPPRAPSRRTAARRRSSRSTSRPMAFARCRARICNLIAGGLALSLESDLPQGATLMSAFAPSSFAGLASSLVVWLLSGGTLALHHPFDGDVLEQQINEHSCDTLIAPAQLALRLGEIDLASRLPTLAQCDRPVARAGTGRIEPGLDRRAGRPDRCLSVRRSRPVRRPPRGRWRAGADPAGTAWRAARRAGFVDRRARSC